MANYGIGGMVPDVVGSVAGGLKAAQGLDYWEDRKRRMAAQDQAQQRQSTMDKNTLGRQAVSDFSQIAKNVNMEDPTEIKQALAWAASRSPEMKNIVWEAIQGGPETSRNLINMFQGQQAGESQNSRFERGKPFVNEANERVIPIYDKQTQELVRTEKLGSQQKKDLPAITWTDDQIDFMADKLIATGEKPMKTRGKEANYLNQLVEKRAAEKQMAAGVGGAETTFLQQDRKAIQKSIVQQQKQRGSMVSFVANLSDQVDHVKDIAKEINAFDTRFLNKPLRWVKKKLKGDPQLSKYEVYLGEIQSEIGKLSSGSTGSVAELSQGAREKWESILDENLSINDMVQILEEVKEAGNIRLKSVDTGLSVSREMLRNVGAERAKAPQKAKKEEEVTTELTYNPQTGGFD